MTIATQPHTDIDLFGDAIVVHPYPAYAELRGMGAAVHLDRIDAWALPRYEHVRAALHDWETFSSAAAVGLNDVVNGFLVGTVLATDPPEHGKLRTVLSEQLAPRAMREIEADIEADIETKADDLVRRLVQCGQCTNLDDIPNAFNEVLRYDPPVQAFAQKLTREVTIPIVLLYGSGNRDERHYPEPNRFDIRGDSADQLAFGYGRHSCAGQALAKIEGHAILKALAHRVRRIHIGEPKRRLNNLTSSPA